MFSLIKFIVLVTIFPHFAFSTDYCNKDLCSNGEKHIACDNSEDFQDECIDATLIELDDTDYPAQIINLNNDYRGQLARGELGFKPAARMPSLIWHQELAYLAELTVKTCKFEPDCHNTDDFAFTGNNVLIIYHPENHIDPKKVIDDAHAKWFEYHKDTTQDVLDNFQETEDTSYIFTGIVQDRTQYIGCGLAQYTTDDNKKASHFSCNYSFGNKEGEPVYKSSDEACSNCNTECTDGLCSQEEDIGVFTRKMPPRNTCPALRK